MNLVFVYPDFMKGAQGKYHEGIASLSAVLKARGNKTELFHIMKELSSQEFSEIFEKRYSNTDLIAFSATTNAFPYVAGYAKEIKKRNNILTICGGAHPTLCPEESITADGIDIICRGEGEYPMSELCDRLGKNEKIDDIRNLWIKKEKNIIKNDVRPLLENLDLLPLPDRDIFDYKNSVDYKWGRLVFMASRGCPFDCSYCCNSKIGKIYPNFSRYARFKSPDRLLEEIRYSLKRAGKAQLVCFHDDILTLDKVWFKDFIFKYAKTIGLPYICNSRFDLVDKEAVGILKETGCAGIKLGLESGNDFIRKEVLKRQQNREDIIKISESCRKAGLRLYTFNMVGIPFENLDKVLDTVKLNAALKPYDMQVSIFYPYPKTDLYEICEEEKFLTNRTLPSYVERDTVLKMDNFPKNEILFAYDNFDNFVEYYGILSSFPACSREFFVKALDFLWNHPKIYRLTFPALFVFRYLCGIIAGTKKNKRLTPHEAKKMEIITDKTTVAKNVQIAQEILHSRRNYNRWIYESIKKYIGERALEVGCGIGNTTQFLLRKELVYGIDISRELLGMINQKYGKLANFKSSRVDIEKDDSGKLAGNYFDTVICLNVIEHLRDDAAALNNMHTLLEEKGRLVLLVPAYQWLYGSMDASHGHIRRYNKRGLAGKLKKAGFSIERMFFMNIPGIFGWFLNGKILMRNNIPARQTLLFDRLVPLFIAFETVFKAFFGLSIICICRRNIK